MDAAKIKAQTLIKENPVVVFSKSYCPYCKATKKKLDGLGVKYTALELNEESTSTSPSAPSKSSPPPSLLGPRHVLPCRRRQNLNRRAFG